MRDIKVSWPLHLVGGGSASDDTVLECPESTSGALIFRCTTTSALTLQKLKSAASACSPVQLLSNLCSGGTCLQEVIGPHSSWDGIEQAEVSLIACAGHPASWPISPSAALQQHASPTCRAISLLTYALQSTPCSP